MKVSFHVLLDYGKYYRVWPFADVIHNRLYVGVGLSRPFTKPVCKLHISKDLGKSWEEIADFCSMDKRNTTTGQPFVTDEGLIFVPTWNAGFYTCGETWFAMYRSEDQGLSWEKVYEDEKGTYGNHFFQNSIDSSLYIGVGVEGGGDTHRIRYTPAKSYLLKSGDGGKTWNKVLLVDYPTALYSGAAVNEKTVLVAAREKKSVFRSMNGGNSWSEISIGKAARNVSFIEEWGKLVLTSDDSIFLSENGTIWNRVSSPVKGLVLRYPTFYEGKIYMTGAGWRRSYVISTDLNNWHIAFDATKREKSNLFLRMAMLGGYIFLGDEIDGVLLGVKLPSNSRGSTNTCRLLQSNLEFSILLAKYKIKGLLKRIRKAF